MTGFSNARTRDEYLTLRRRYEPESPTLIIVAESPPASRRYFYDPDGAITEPLFAALMKQLGISAATKEHGLWAFEQQGWVLVDATYEAVNKLTSGERDGVIRRDHSMLRKDVRELAGKGQTPVVLLKVNVCRILEPMLTAEGFTVLNRGRKVPFPSTGQQTRFHAQFGTILDETGLGPSSSRQQPLAAD